MNNIREISDRRIASLKRLSNKEVNLDDLKHMRNGDNFLDLDKAEDWIEAAAFDRVTKDPKRQSDDENRQLLSLQSLFPTIKKPETPIYLVGGLLIEDESSIVAHDDPPDIDAVMEDGEWKIVWTLKGGQDMDGTAQHRQFTDVLRTINEAPTRSSTDKTMLVVLVNGNFWIKPRPRKYKNFTPPKKPFNLVDLLNDKANHKKCLIFSDNKLPLGNFYDSYIKDSYV